MPLGSNDQRGGQDSCFPETSVHQETGSCCAQAFLNSNEGWASLQHALTFLDAKELVVVYSIYQQRHEQVPECRSSCCSHCLLIRLEAGKCNLPVAVIAC